MTTQEVLGLNLLKAKKQKIDQDARRVEQERADLGMQKAQDGMRKAQKRKSEVAQNV